MENVKEEDKKENNNYFRNIKELFMNPCFILLCLSLDGLYFVITGIQYWITDYLINRIK